MCREQVKDCLRAIDDTPVRSIVCGQLEEFRCRPRPIFGRLLVNSFLNQIMFDVSECRALTSRRYMKAVSSLNVNALPCAIVCAVSPAQRNPFGFLPISHSTNRGVHSGT